MQNDDILARLDHIESTQAIQMLPSRYALAVDSRDVESLVGLFVEDVDAGKWGKGRAALREFYLKVLTAFYRSQHQIVGHVFDFIDPDHATGTVYCRAEHEEGDNWVVMIMTYFDAYERHGGRWFFRRRTPAYFYACNIDDRPRAPFVNWSGRDLNPKHFQGSHAFKTWQPFWQTHGAEVLPDVTRQP
jgi:hypothetical protein